MSKRSPRPRTTRRGKRPNAGDEAPKPEPISEELPSIILSDDLAAEPEEPSANQVEPPADPDPAPFLDAEYELDSTRTEGAAGQTGHPSAHDFEDAAHDESRAAVQDFDDAPSPSTRATVQDFDDAPSPSTRTTIDDTDDAPRSSTRATVQDFEDPASSSTRATIDDAGNAVPPHAPPLARSPLASFGKSRPPTPAKAANPETAPRPQRYALAYDDSAPVELPKYIEDEPRPVWRPPTPAPPYRPSDPLDDVDVDLRPNRRKYNWLLVLACVIVGVLGVALGSRPTPKAPGPDAAVNGGPDASGDTGADTMGEPGDSGERGESGDATSGERADGGPGELDTLIRPTRPDVSPPSPATARALDEAKRALDERRWDAALAASNKAIANAPENPRALFGRARALSELGRLEEAVRDMDAVLAIDPTHPYALLLAGETLEKHGRGSDARAYFERYLTAWPKTRKAEALRKRFPPAAP